MALVSSIPLISPAQDPYARIGVLSFGAVSIGCHFMTDYPLQVKIVASLAIVLAYACLPLFGVVYLAGYWADIAGSRAHRKCRSRS